MIYLDNASTTRIAPEVYYEMGPYLFGQYGNPGSLHTLGQNAKKAVEKAREQVAHFIGARPEQIIFTSGGTESNNTAVFSVRDNTRAKHIVTGLSEHDSVLESVNRLCINNGFSSTLIGTQPDGSVSLTDVEAAIRDDTGLVSFMYVNNETGAENPVEEIGELCIKKGIPFHTDCVQAASVNKIDVSGIGCAALSLSSHKLHGPKGVGALYIKSPDLFKPLIAGGSSQEFGLRGGTENVAGIVGFGAACALMERDLKEQDIHTSVLKQVLYTRISEGLSACGLDSIMHLNGDCLLKHGKILNVRFDGVDGETLLLLLDKKGVFVSAGSACRSHEQEPSKTLLAMGVSPEDARNSVRISFSKYNTEIEVIEAAEAFVSSVSALYQWRAR